MEGEKLYIGPYEIQGLLGRGGMGSVYLAQHSQTKQQVAIKQLNPDSFSKDQELLDRLKREGEALALLNHPNIVKMLEVVEEKGRYSLVLEYVEGGSLQDLLQRQAPLPIDAIVKIALELADALTRAHHLRIIHRDIKPANILFARDGTLRLTDFGLARMEHGNELTKSGVMLGSMAYLSPEAIEGTPPDPRLDIWAFGVTLYEMLAGYNPFASDNLALMLNNILSQAPQPISVLRPDTPPRLAALVMMMLSKHPEERPASTRQVAATLEQVAQELSPQQDLKLSSEIRQLISQPRQVEEVTQATLFVTPTTAVTRQDVRTPRKARPWLWATGSALGLLSLLLFGYLFSQARSNSAPSAPALVSVPPVAEDEVMVLVTQLVPDGAERPQVSRVLAENLSEVLQASTRLTGLQVRAYPHSVRSEEEARAVAEHNQAALVVWGRYDPEGIDLHIDAFALSEQPGLSEAFLQRAANVRLSLQDERAESIAPQVLASATIWYAYHSRIFELAATMVVYNDLRDAGLVSAETLGLGVGANVNRHFEALYRDPETAVRALDSALQSDPENPILYHLRASAVERLGRNAQAMDDVKTAQFLSQERWSLPYLNQANLLSVTGNIPGAIPAMDKAIALKQDWIYYTVRGSFYYLEGDLTQAERDIRAAIALGPKANFPYILLMNISVQKGNIQEAQDLLALILERFPDPTLGNRIILTANNTADYGGYYSLMLSAFNNLVLQRYEASLDDIEKALAFRADSPDLYLFQGLVYCALEQYKLSERAYTEGLALKPEMTVLYLLRADVRNRLNKGAEALQDFIAAQDTPAWPAFEPIVSEALASGSGLGCESFFEVPS
jgi:serine/threonine protein kinase/tetratricopeptide (TPR) repeat protein